MIQVVKLGGAVLEDDALRTQVLKDFAGMSGPKILVHGGGREADQLAAKLEVPVQKVEGRRVTDEATLKLVTMAYGGWLNKRVVAQLQALGVDALGLSGADANVVTGTKRKPNPVDYGLVGDVAVEGVNADRLLQLAEIGLTPVLCALTHTGTGQLLNTNADTLASIVAQALAAKTQVALSLCFEKPGVLTNVDDDDSWLPKLSQEEFAEMKAQGQVHTGMIPKLEAGFAARQAGAKVWVKAASNLMNNKGTEII